MPGEILTLKEVAAFLKVAEKTVYTLAQRGELPGFKVGGQWRFRQTALEKWIDAQSAHMPTSGKSADKEAASVTGAIISLDMTRTLLSPESSLRVTIAGRYDLDEQFYQLRNAGELVAIEPKAFDLLAYFIRHRNRVVSKAELIEQLWPQQIVTESSLTQCVAKVRMALRENGIDPVPIRNVYGRGYRFTLPVTVPTSLTMRKVKPQQVTHRPHFSSPNPAAAAAFANGCEHLLQMTPEALEHARCLYEHAITLDPHFAPAYAALAWTYWMEWAWWYHPERTILDLADAFARKAVTLDGALASAHLTLGYVYFFQHQHEQAIAEAKRSLALDPQYAWAYAMLADMKVSVGRADEALPLIDTAMRIDPQSATYFTASLGLTYRALGRHDEAIAALCQTLAHNPQIVSARLLLTVLYSEVGQSQAAREELTLLQQHVPRFSITGLRQRLPYRDRSETDRIVAALNQAGLN